MNKIDIPNVDDMLLNSFGMPDIGNMSDIGNIDFNKYHKSIFSPSPTKNLTPTSVLPPSSPIQKINSPQKAISPHVVPLFQHSLPHHQPPLTPLRRQPQQQAIFSPLQLHHQQQTDQIQRKLHVGPHFDRLGILNQANEIPQQLNAPFFAKALQQHGSTTLGAILQAHQHALQQHFQRENFLHMQQQVAQQQMFQMPMNNLYHHQRINPMIRTDDQIVPNPQVYPQQDVWLQLQNPNYMQSKQIQRKREDIDSDSSCSSFASHSSSRSKKQKFEDYVIFNDDKPYLFDEEKEDTRIAPPNKSVFVCYQSESNKSLPSFSEAFTGHVNNLKIKEKKTNNLSNKESLSSQILSPNLQQATSLNIYSETKTLNSFSDENENSTKKEIENIEQTNKNCETEKETVQCDLYSDFLNSVGKDRLFSYNTDIVIDTKRDETDLVSNKILNVHKDGEESNKTSDNINIFNEDLDLDSEHAHYENLFNTSSDDNYFQTFKDNNLHLINELHGSKLINELHVSKLDGNDDLAKLLHSPMDFLNDKF